MSEEKTAYSNPMTISQCTSLNGEKFKAWSSKRLGTVKYDELNKKGKQWDLSAVAYNVSSNKKSALLYAYNFGFNIPENARITKVIVKQCFCGDNNRNGRAKTYLVKLKTGASTSNTGVGYNKSDNVKWRTHAYAHQHGMQYSYIGDTTSSVKEFWGVELTPSMINNSDFGCVVQVNATSSSGHKVYMDNIQMRVYYTLEEVTPSDVDTSKQLEYMVTYRKQDTLSEKTVNLYPSTQAYDNPKSIPFYVRYQNNCVTDSEGKKYLLDATSDVLYVVTDGKLLFEGAIKQKRISSRSLKGTDDKRYFGKKTPRIWYYYECYVYINPNVAKLFIDNDEVTSTITLYKNSVKEENKCNTITFTIESGNSNIPYSQTIIKNCKFVDNTANKGSAIYNTGRIYTYNNYFSDNFTIDSNGATQRDSCQFFDVNFCRVVEEDEPNKQPTFPIFDSVKTENNSVDIDVSVHSSDNTKVTGNVDLNINKKE